MYRVIGKERIRVKRLEQTSKKNREKTTTVSIQLYAHAVLVDQSSDDLVTFSFPLLVSFLRWLECRAAPRSVLIILSFDASKCFSNYR